MRKNKNLFIALGVLIVLTPLGLISQGTAWGEWSADELKKMLGYIPKGLVKLNNFRSSSLFPQYSIPGGKGNFLHSSLGYILSAVTGVSIIFLVTMGIGKIIAAREDSGEDSGEDSREDSREDSGEDSHNE